MWYLERVLTLNKIIHIITGLNRGGAEASLYRLCTSDTSNQHIVISLLDSGKYGTLLQEAGITVHSLNMPRGRITLNGLWRLSQLLTNHYPDVVQTWMYHADLIGGVVAKIVGIKHVYWGIRHSNLEKGKAKRSTIFIAKLCAVLSPWVPEKIVSCSHQAALAHQTLGYQADKFVIIPNGFDLTEYKPDEVVRRDLRIEWNIDEDAQLIGMVARFDPQKDHRNLFSALVCLMNTRPDFKCVLVGDGMTVDNGELLSCLDAYGLRNKVLLLGPRDDIIGVMNALDVHVLSSLGEAFPNVLAEAMACGTPCVTTDVGDAALIVGDTGWVVERQNPEALASAIRLALDAISDTTARTVRSRQCREHIMAHFSVERMLDKYQRCWRTHVGVEGVG